MRTGQRNRRVRIEEPVETDSAMGSQSRSWRTVCRAWAAVWPVSGREALQGSQVRAEAAHLVNIRYRPGIREDMRLVMSDGRILEIQSLSNLREAGRELEIVCVEQKS